MEDFVIKSQSLRESGHLFLRRCVGGQVWRGKEYGRNPFVNQVICFARLAKAISAVVWGESQSLRESGHLFLTTVQEYIASGTVVAIPS